MRSDAFRASGPGRIGTAAVASAFILLTLIAAPGRAQIAAHGQQFQVNSYTTGDQYYSRVAIRTGGDFIVVWDGTGSPGPNSHSYDIVARRFTADGAPVGADFQINEYFTNDQEFPAIAATPGGFVVVWRSSSFTGIGDDSDGGVIEARRYDANGNALGGEFQVNGYTTGDQRFPSIAADAAGNFVIVWDSYGSPGSDGGDLSIQARRYDSSGNPLAAQFQVNSFTTGDQIYPAAAMSASGAFVVAWQSAASNGSDTNGYSILARRFDPSGAPVAVDFQVNSYTTGDQRFPVVALNSAGKGVVVWQGEGSGGSDTNAGSIHARRYAADGNAAGPDFQVNSYGTGAQQLPSVAIDPAGGFLAAWQSPGSTGGDVGSLTIAAQRYDAAGAPMAGEFQVNSYSTGNQNYATVATDPDGNFILAWSSLGSPGTDQDGFSLQARRFDGLFRDGFESSGSSRWSTTFP